MLDLTISHYQLLNHVGNIIQKEVLMADWLSQYALNLYDTMFWPMVVLTVVSAIIAFHSYAYRGGKKAPPFGSIEYASATWRIWACVQGIVIGWLFMGIVGSVPPLDYQTKVVYKYKERSAVSTYDQVFSQCVDNIRKIRQTNDSDVDKCEITAYKILRPDVKIRTMVVKVVRMDTYDTLYGKCMLNTDRDSVTRKRCHNSVIEAMAARRNEVPIK